MIARAQIRIRRERELDADAEIPALAQPAAARKAEAQQEILFPEVIETIRQRLDILVVGALDIAIRIAAANNQVRPPAKCGQRNARAESGSDLCPVPFIPAQAGTDVAASHIARALDVALPEQPVEPSGCAVDNLLDSHLRRIEQVRILLLEPGCLADDIGDITWPVFYEVIGLRGLLAWLVAGTADAERCQQESDRQGAVFAGTHHAPIVIFVGCLSHGPVHEWALAHALRLLDVIEDAVQLIEAVIANRELAALLAVIDADPGAKAIRDIHFETANVGVVFSFCRRFLLHFAGQH